MSAALLQAMFVLLFPARAPRSFAGFGDAPGGKLEALPGEDARARTGQLQEVQAALLGREYLQSRRLARWPAGRVRFTPSHDGDGPDHADVFLITHTAGAALWECWIPLPAQSLDTARWTGWLRPGAVGSGSLSAVLAEQLAGAAPFPSPVAPLGSRAGSPPRLGPRPALAALAAGLGHGAALGPSARWQQTLDAACTIHLAGLRDKLAGSRRRTSGAGH